MLGALQQPTCELPSPSPQGSLAGKQFVARLVLGTLLGKPQRRTVAFLLSQQVAGHVIPEALLEAQVEVDRLLEPLGTGARASLQRLREKHGIAFNFDTESSDPAEETKFAFDNKNAPVLDKILNKDVTRDKDTATPSKKIDSKYEWVDVVQGRTRTEAEPHVLPTHIPGLVADVQKVRIIRKSTTQSKMKLMRQSGRSVEHWRRLALLDPGPSGPVSRRKAPHC